MQKNYKSQEIQFLLTEILPRLAAFNSSLFQEHFLSDTFNYLTMQVQAHNLLVFIETYYLIITL